MGCVLAAWFVGATRKVPFVKKIGEYSIGIYVGANPFELSPCPQARNPVLTARDVSDVDAEFVADPFMVREGDTWHMFFEVLNRRTGQGDIGLATSNDARNWTYQRIVLDEPFHLSYPLVFKVDGEYYMVPETRLAYAVRLYKATEFPLKWTYVKDLVQGNYVDPTVFHDGTTWWMFAGERADVLHLYYAEDLYGPWTKHPKSPVVLLDGDIARPGGPVVRHEGRFYRYTQDGDPTYGNQVRAFEITTLTKEDYEERPVESNPIIAATGRGWNAEQMHHIDPHYVEGVGWIAIVDGCGTSLKYGLAY